MIEDNQDFFRDALHKDLGVNEFWANGVRATWVSLCVYRFFVFLFVCCVVSVCGCVHICVHSVSACCVFGFHFPLCSAPFSSSPCFVRCFSWPPCRRSPCILCPSPARQIELETVVSECKHMLKNIGSYAKPQSVSTPLLSMPGSSFIVRLSSGCCRAMC